MGSDQGLVQYEFIPEGCTLNEEKHIKILHCFKDAVRRKYLKNGLETAGFFCVTELTCTLVIGGQKLLCQLEM
jgi:hypothetical protein